MKQLLSFFIVFTLSLLQASWSVSTAQAEATIAARDSVSAGSQIEISVSGLESKKDFVTIVSPETPEGKYSEYKYPKTRPSITLFAPEDPGTYEIRLLSGENGYGTITTRPLQVTEVKATVTSDKRIKAGGDVKVSWTGPGNQKDFITIVEKDADEGTYGPYKYARSRLQGKGVTLVAPEEPGEYEVRYVTGNKRYTLASHQFTVTSVSADVSGPTEVTAGAVFQVDWNGPDNQKDFLTIVPVGTEEGNYNDYKYVRRKFGPRKLHKVEFTAPEFAGDYEVRYVSGQKRLTLASMPIKVTSTEATVSAAKEVMEGASFEVDWTGPDNAQDFITLVPLNEKEGKTGSTYVYVRRKQGPRNLQKVTLIAPETTGDFEIRYVTGRKRLTLASMPIKVVPASATIEAPTEAPVRDVISVSWEGPGNNGDYIALVRPDSETNELDNYAYTRRGKTLRIKTPNEPGSYEVRYVTAKLKKVLAKKPIEITPSMVPGTLKVISTSEQASMVGGNMSVALILDASGSMLKRENGNRRIEIAKNAVNGLLNGPLSEGTPFSLRVFGHKEADSCRTDLEIPLAPLKRDQASSTVKGITAKNLAKTPIARSLELVKSDLESAEGKRVVILVTDGEETCEGDPEAAIRALAASGFDTRVNIVGFAIDEYMLKETFQEWARLGNGKYFDAANAEELERSIIEAIEVPYEVLNKEQKVVASGVINGEPISVLPGSYTIRVLSSPEEKIEDVKIDPERQQLVKFSG